VVADAANDLTLRDDLISTAFNMIKLNPWIGVGPVQYGPYLTQMVSEPDPHIVHNIPLLVTAEFGIVVGIVFTVWIAAMVVRSVRFNVYAAAIGLSMLPFFVFDNLHYVYGNGIAMFAIWIALLDYHSDNAVESGDDSSVAHTTVQDE
jgi:O-antigen ligase